MLESAIATFGLSSALCVDTFIIFSTNSFRFDGIKKKIFALLLSSLIHVLFFGSGYFVAAWGSQWILNSDHWIAAAILFALAIKIFKDSLHVPSSPSENTSKGNIWTFTLLSSIATSFDALGAGSSYAFTHSSVTPMILSLFVTTLLTGILSFSMDAWSVRHIPPKYLLQLSGSVFFILALKVLWEHLGHA